MVYGFVLAMLLAGAFAINGQQDFNYETFQSEVSALKNVVFNMNVELVKIRDQHDEMRKELMTLRSSKQSTDTYPSMKLDEYDSYPKDIENNGKDTLLNKRAPGYTPSVALSSLWDRSKASAPKGEKGDSGLQGPKGDRGTRGTGGQKGDTGTTGATGQKGNNDTPGIVGSKGGTGSKGHRGHTGEHGHIGPKGNTGIAGTTGQKGGICAHGHIGPMGPMGPKGNTGIPGTTGQKGSTGAHGHIGPMGPIGPKGNVGLPGTTGQKGDTGTAAKANEISFSGEILLRKRNEVFDQVKWNHGNDYNPATRIFSCEVPGVYLFTLAVGSVSPVNDTLFFMKFNEDILRPLSVSASSNGYNTGSVTAMVSMSRGQTVSLQHTAGEDNAYVLYQFEGVLLY